MLRRVMFFHERNDGQFWNHRNWSKNCIDDYEAKSDGRKQEEFNSHYSSIGDKDFNYTKLQKENHGLTIVERDSLSTNWQLLSNTRISVPLISPSFLHADIWTLPAIAFFVRYRSHFLHFLMRTYRSWYGSPIYGKIGLCAGRAWK